MGVTRLRTVMVRGIEEEVWVALRAVAIRDRVRLGVLLGRIIRAWLATEAGNGRVEEVA